jgi:hypothetical protein
MSADEWTWPEEQVTQVADRLWLGGSWAEASAGQAFDVCVTVCHPHEAVHPPGCPEVSMPLDDPGSVDVDRLAAVADVVEKHLAAGDRVLVRCRVGLNRSALAVAVVLHRATGQPGAFILDRLRSARGPDVLCNEDFAAHVRAL